MPTIPRRSLLPRFALPIVAVLAAALSSGAVAGAPAGTEGGDWPCVGGDRGCMRYSPLEAVNRDNVGRLRVAWTYHTGELDRPGKTIECTPIEIEGTVYVTTAYLRVVALDAASGAVRWEFDPMAFGPPSGPLASGGVNRGVAWWSDGQPDGWRRILHGAADGRLFALDARTGKPDPAFGRGGVVDLRAGMEFTPKEMPYGPTSAPGICGDAVIVGFSCGEGPGAAAPGDVRAFDVRSGRELWRFRTVPRPGEPGNDTWEGESWKDRGAANAWGGVSVDEARGLVFVGTGSAAFDFYGGDRKGQNLFANCTLALDARTGERRWHFQTLHHDLWDHDLPTYPNLVRVAHDGRMIDAVAQVTKTGYVFLFDRETGRPLFEVDEVPVPASDVPGEEAWPTQPVPRRPPTFARQRIDEGDLGGFTPESRAAVAEQFRKHRTGPAALPPSLRGTVVIPGFHGGATWSGASFDPETGILYVNSNNVPNVVTLAENPPGSRDRYTHTGYHKFLDPEGYPAVKPPWGLLNAIDLNRGEFAWQVLLGERPELTARGIPRTGSENFGGTIVTRGGLVFIGSTMDEKFRAFDKSSGEVLWEHPLPAGGYAAPCTYSHAGRQYVLIAAGGAGKLGTKAGDAFVAFALPE